MIDVKGTKSAPTEAPDGYQRYMLKSDGKHSKAPLFFTFFLAGIALYLKSAFPSLAKAPQQDSDDGPSSEPAHELAVVSPVDAADMPLPEETAPWRPEKIADLGRTFESEKSEGYTLADSWPITFQALRLPNPVLLRKFGDISASFYAANDNAWISGRGGAPGFSGGNTVTAAPQDPIWADEQQAEEDDQNGMPDQAEDRDADSEKTNNRAPRTSGSVYLMDIYGCAVAFLGLSDLLQGALDPDGDLLAVRNLTVSSGNLTQTASGWSFNATSLGPVTVTYEITDGALSVAQTARFSVLANPLLVGTTGDDVLLGSNCADEIFGRTGHDNIDSLGGDDVVDGGEGDDHILAGRGNDIVFAGAGNDIVLGGEGDDQIWGGGGNDRLFGDDGNDTLFGESGDDALSGGGGNDLLLGGEGQDILTGEDGDDRADGGNGDDRLDGGTGNDILLGQAGTDVLDGGQGDDLLIGGGSSDDVRGGDGKDTLVGDIDQAADRYDGGEGIDTLDYAAATQSVAIDLGEGTAFGAETGYDSILNVEVVRAGGGDDEIRGSQRSEEISGNGGGDLIEGAGGNDGLHGNDGHDHLSGGAGEDAVNGDAGDDTVVGDLDVASDVYDGGEGIDTLDYSAAVMSIVIDLVAASATGAEIGNDKVTNFEVIRSGEGADEIRGGAGDDTLIGSGGDDVVMGGDGADTLRGEAGADIISDGQGADAVLAGSGDDVVVASADAADDSYDGQAGFDTLDYSQAAHGVLIDLAAGTATGFDIGQDIVGGFERVVCGDGDDTVQVGDMAAVLQGGNGADRFTFQVAAGASGAEVIHQILDFMVGDRIEVSKYQIFEDAINSIEERFEDVYGEQATAEALPIRVRHEGTDELEQTLIEVDMDRDQHYEMTINLTGHHVLMIVENV